MKILYKNSKIRSIDLAPLIRRLLFSWLTAVTVENILIPVDLADTDSVKYFTGLSDGTKITDAAVYESMMGSQAFSLVMVRVADAAEAKEIAQHMKDNIDPRKWICVGADEVMAAGYGDTVLFVMLDSSLGLKAQSYVDAFTDICGGKLDFTI